MDKYRAAKLLARHIEIEGVTPMPQDLIDPHPEPHLASPCWHWIGAYRPKTPDAHKTNPLGLINMPRPITTIGGVERNPVKPLMCLQADLPFDDEPTRIHRRCKDRRCVNPYHHSANVADSTILRRLFP